MTVKKSQSKPSPSLVSASKISPEVGRLKRLFTSLVAQVDDGHFTNAIKTCNKILAVQADDPDALQTKLFLLLQTDQYKPALALMDASTDVDYTFERAYALYRLQNEADATKLLTEMKQEHRGMLHLEAQLSYRQGNYQKAFDSYNQLLDSAEPQSEEHSDILTNLQASQKHLDFINKDFLRALDALPTSLTADLESAPPPSQPSSSLLTVAPTTDTQVHAPIPAAKKVRASRVPPNVIPGVTPPPDPERWLKKSERSTFGVGQRRRKGGAGGGGATQGSASIDPTPAASHTVKGAGAKGKKKK